VQVRLDTAASPTREDRGQGPTWTPGLTRARAGVHGGAGRRVREATRANTSTNASTNGSVRRRGHEQQRTVFNQRRGKARPRERRALTKAATPANVLSQPGTKVGIISGGAEKRSVPPRLEGRGIHKGREAVVLISVATGRSAGVGVSWWCGSSAGKKTRAATRRRGRRGSRGSRHSRRRRVRLLPRAAPVFAADGSSHGRLLFSFSSPSTPLLLRRVSACGRRATPRGG
jgi:hypothetical protein